MSATSDPRPSEGWFSDAYRRMALIGMAMSAPCLVLGITQALLHQDGRLLARVVAAVPGSVLLTFAAIAVTRMLLGATDEMSLWLIADERPRRRRVRREDGAAPRRARPARARSSSS